MAQDLSTPAEEQIVTDPSPTPQDQQVEVTPEDVFAKSMEGAFPEEAAAPAVQEPPALSAAEQQAAAPPPPEWNEAPTNWPQEEREKFAALPEDQKQFIYGTVTSAHRAAQMKMDQAAEIRQVVSQFVDKMGQPTNQAPQAPEPAKDDQPPDDLVDKLKWEVKNEIREEITKKDQEREEQNLVATRQQTIDKVATDPEYQAVRQVLDRKWQAEPATLKPGDPQGRTYQQVMYDQLNADPAYYQAELSERTRSSAGCKATSRTAGSISACSTWYSQNHPHAGVRGCRDDCSDQ